MGIMKSSLTGEPWKYGTEVTDDDIRELQALMEKRERH